MCLFYSRCRAVICAAFVFLLIAAASAHAQSTQTWVSGVGDDANPCSRTAPCRTFIAALARTAPGGEISVLDPGSFGAVNITNSITINGGSTLAGILSSGTNAVVVNAGPTDVVILRGLSINGAGAGLNGIKYLAGATLVIEHCSVYGFTSNDIDVSLTASGNLLVKDTTLTGGDAGIHLTSTTGRLAAAVDRTTILAARNGIDSLYGFAQVNNSLIAGNTAFGVLAEGGAITLTNSLLTNNGVAVQAQTRATVRLSNNEIFNNLTGLGCGGGTLASAENNRKAGNSGGTVPACSPNATVNVQ